VGLVRACTAFIQRQKIISDADLRRKIANFFLSFAINNFVVQIETWRLNKIFKATLLTHP
jgi:hypothetical protein